MPDTDQMKIEANCCGCLDKLNEQLPKGAGELKTTFARHGDGLRAVLAIRTTENKAVFANYCPWCGTSWVPDKADAK